MSEYMESHSVSRMIGSPPGYVGYSDGGQLTEAVRKRPFKVILFDEIEKAHPDVFNILLQILEDGRLTDGQGRLVDFKNTIIIMTSNLGSSVDSSDSLGFVRNPETSSDREKLRISIEDALKKSFRPEFLNLCGKFPGDDQGFARGRSQWHEGSPGRSQGECDHGSHDSGRNRISQLLRQGCASFGRASDAEEARVGNCSDRGSSEIRCGARKIG